MVTDFEKRIINEYTADPIYRKELYDKVEEGAPLAYLIGEWYFWRGTFKITSDCLIPRPDTERIVETALEFLPQGGHFADLCTGSGCIGISILTERTDTSCIAVDLSEGALRAATENAERFGVSHRFFPVCQDLLTSDLPNRQADGLDVIVSNPPYIQTNVLSQSPELMPEPAMALDGGEDGLIFYRRMTASFAKNLKPGGHFIFEIGYDQADDLRKIARNQGMSCEIRKDYGGNDRVAILQKKTRE